VSNAQPPGDDLEARLRRDAEALRAGRDGCPPPDLLFAREADALDAHVRARLAAHVAACEACRRLADDFDSLGLGEPDAAAADRVAVRLWGRATRPQAGFWAIAATLALTSGLAFAVWLWRTAPLEAPAALPMAGGITPQPAPIVALWSVAPPPVRVPLSSLEVPRGEGPAADGVALVAALEPYQAGDYAAAAERLTALARDAPGSGEVQFYLGVSHLLAGRPDAAASELDRALTLLPPPRHAEAAWYLATAEQRAGLADRARARLHVLCRQPGAYQALACAAEASLK
jgi:TolA-binding protein